jgi:hypothetical protein
VAVLAVPATWEAEAGGLLEPRSSKASLGNIARPSLLRGEKCELRRLSG